MSEVVSLINEKETIVGHNIKFDLRFLYYEGGRVPPKIVDTMLGVHLLDENTGSLSLKKLCSKIFGKKSVERRKEPKRRACFVGLWQRRYVAITTHVCGPLCRAGRRACLKII